MMTLSELIEELEALREEYGDDVEVRLAHQPNWPFEYSIGQLAGVTFEKFEGRIIDRSECDEDVPYDGSDEGPDPDVETESVIYIGESHQIGYLPGSASRALGWR